MGLDISDPIYSVWLQLFGAKRGLVLECVCIKRTKYDAAYASMESRLHDPHINNGTSEGRIEMWNDTAYASMESRL